MEYPTKVRETPRMSAPKLGEYLEAGPRRRERILRDQKFPPVFKQARYDAARKAIKVALVGTQYPVVRLHELAAQIAQRPTRTRYAADTVRGNIDALAEFADLYPKIFRGDSVRPELSPAFFSIPIEGVGVTVAPSALLKKTPRTGVVQIGALVVVIRKESALGDQSGKGVAETIRQALITAGYINVRPELCLALDLFSHRWFTPSLRGIGSTEDLRAACREIATRWPALRYENAA
jgi:hypothetical protein